MSNQSNLNRSDPAHKKASVGDKLAALITLINELKADLNQLKTDHNAHTHGGVTAGAGTTGVPSALSGVSVTSPDVALLN